MATIGKATQVVDDFGDVLSKAHVFIDSKNGTTTNDQGRASLRGDENSIVTISYVGKQPRQYRLKDLPAKVTLSMETMQEVVVNGNKKSSTPKYLWPAIGATFGLLVLMSIGSEPKKVTL